MGQFVQLVGDPEAFRGAFSRFERWHSWSDTEKYLLLKLSTSYFLNTSVIPLLASTRKNWYTEGGFAEQVFYTQLIDAVMAPLMAMMDPSWLCSRLSCQYAKTQDVLDKILVPPEFSLSIRYSDSIKTLSMAVIFAPMVPSSPLIGLLGILMLAAYGMSQPKANAIPVAVIVAVICLTGFTGQSQIRETHQKFEEVHRLTSEIKAELEKANQVDFSTFRQIVVLGEEGSGKWPIDQLSKVKLGNTGHGEGLNRGSVRWARSFQETPAQKVHVCIIDDGASKGFCYNRLPEEERLNNWPCGGVHLGFCRNVRTNKDAIILRLPRPGEATE